MRARTAIFESVSEWRLKRALLLFLAAIPLALAFVRVDQYLVGSTPATPVGAQAQLADCLWHAARNHGFYDVQRNAIQAGRTRGNHELWKGFVQSTGRDECAYAGGDLRPVAAALLATEAAADRYFAAEVLTSR